MSNRHPGPHRRQQHALQDSRDAGPLAPGYPGDVLRRRRSARATAARGGRSNQREVDVIVNEVIPERCRVSAAQITVLDEGWRGRTGLAFVDDPQKINVDVS
jgi:hypothetical protein